MRYVQREEAKCNFCANWFPVSHRINGYLNVCAPCLQHARSYNTYIVPNEDGIIYRLFLLPKFSRDHTLEASPCLKDQISARIDLLQEREIQSVIQKWAHMHKTAIETSGLIDASEGMSLLQKIQNAIQSPSKDNYAHSIDLLPLGEKEMNKIGLSAGKGQPNMLGLSKRSKCDKENSIKDSIKKTAQSRIPRTPREIPKVSEFIPFVNQSPFGNPESKKWSIARYEPQQKIVETAKLIEGDDEGEPLCGEATKTSILEYLQRETTVPVVLSKIMAEQIYEAVKSTKGTKESLELVRFNLSEMDIGCYLHHLDFEGVKVLKLVKSKLTSEQFAQVLRRLETTGVETLVVTNNALTEEVFDFLQTAPQGPLKKVYLGNNHFVSKRAKKLGKSLEARFNLFY